MSSRVPHNTDLTRFYKSGAFRLAYTNALQHFSSEHAHPAKVIAEVVDNGKDAGARLIVIELSQDCIRVTDNGRGMVPWIRDEDHEEIGRFFTEIEQGIFDPRDIRDRVTRESLMSIEWMAVMAAYSGKQIIDPTMRGEKGVGIQSTRSLGEHIRIHTLPSRELAHKYWGEGQYVSDPPLLDYEFPTMKQLRSTRDVAPNIVFGDSQRRDQFKNSLGQGTKIEITKIRDGVLGLIQPDKLRKDLEVRFGNDVAQGLQIIIIDNLTKEGRREGGLRVPIKAASYSGTSVYSGIIPLSDESVQCRAEIFHSVGRNATGVKIRRKGSDVLEITDLRELDVIPLNAGNLSGFIEYPDIPGAEWDSKKTEPLMGPVRKDWVRAVKSILPEIRQKIESIESRARNAQLTEVSRQVGEAMIQALGEIEDFAPITVQTGRRPRPEPGERTGKERNPDFVQDRLIVRVENEHRQPLSGITLTMTPPHGEKVEKTTEASGQVSFGKDLWSHYPDIAEPEFTVTMVVPSGMEPLDSLTVQTATLTSSKPGQRLIFRLLTGRPGPRPFNVRQIIPIPVQDLGVIYSAKDLPYGGKVYIDMDMGEYGTAARENNLDRIAELTALYVACALTEIAYNHEQQFTVDAPEQLMKAAELAGKAIGVFRERFGRRRK